MSTTGALISKIQRAVTNYSRQQILDTLNEVLMIVYSENMAQTLALDATGQPPYFPTIGGTYKYDAPVDAREIIAVAVDAGMTFGNDYRYGVPVMGYGDTITLNNRQYRVVPCTTLSATPYAGASVLFTDNPGDNPTVYRIIYYKKAPQLESENDEIPLPEECFWELRKAVLAILSTANYGATGFDDTALQNTCLLIRKKMNRGAQARVGRTGLQIQDIAQYSTATQGYGRRRI